MAAHGESDNSSFENSLPPLRPLKDILIEWGVEDIVEGGFSDMSGELMARISPSFHDDQSEALSQYICNGVPVFAPERCAQRVKNEVKGDGIGFVCSEEWDAFPDKKVAMVGGWGRPGTLVDAINDRDIVLVSSFSEVLTDPRILNLQMFHRPGESNLPILPDLLDWPCDTLFQNENQNYSAVTVDRATRVSRKGAVTWWHLDDSGEHVFQVALPLIGDSSGKRVKVFIFAEVDDYDFIFQDDETNATGRVAAFDPFRTPTNALPKGGRLPTFWVAGLEAGGLPLLSPPNMPHLVLTAQNCVMVEERRVSILFLDEVAYFLNRASRWHTMPILYGFLRENLCDSAQVEIYMRQLISLSNQNMPWEIAACARQSLLSVFHFIWHSRFTDMGLDRSLMMLHQSTIDQLNANLTNDNLTLRYNRHRRVNELMLEMRQEVTDLGGEKLRYCSVLHDNGRAVWGVARTNVSDALDDHLVLQLALDAGSLEATLTSMNQESSVGAVMKVEEERTPSQSGNPLDSIFGSDSDED